MVALFQYFMSMVRPRVMAGDAWCIRQVLLVGKQESTRTIRMEGNTGKGERAIEGGDVEGWGRLGEGAGEEENWIAIFL